MKHMTRLILRTAGRCRSTARHLPAWAILLVLSAAAMASLRVSQAWAIEPDIVALVNGEPVTRVEVQRLLATPTHRRGVQEELGVEQPDAKDLERLALRNLIYRRLLLQEAAQRSLTVTEQELNRHFGKFRSHLKNPRKYSAWLKANGLDDKSLREYMRANLLIARVQMALVEGLEVKEQQVQEYYDAHKEKIGAASRQEVERQLLAAKRKEVIKAWLKEKETKSTIEVWTAEVGDQVSGIGGAMFDVQRSRFEVQGVEKAAVR